MFVAFLLSRLIMSGLAFLSGYFHLETYLSQNVLIVLISTLLYVLMLVVLFGLIKLVRFGKLDKQTLGVRKTLKWKDFGLALAGSAIYFVLMIVLIILASILMPWVDMTQTQETGLSVTFNRVELGLMFGLLVVVGPIAEEIIFRGYMHGELRRRGVSVFSTILITSLLFGAVHMQWNVAIVTFALGIVMSLTREISGTIWASVMIHMLKNGIAYYFLFINPIANLGG